MSTTMSTTTTTATNHLDYARINAICHADSIIALHNAFIWLDTGDATTIEVDGCTFESADDVLDYAQEYPLAIEVRTGWDTPGADPTLPEEFRIALSLGGPTLWVRGSLDAAGEPSLSPYLEYSDQSTPPTRLVPNDEDSIDSEDLQNALQWFVWCFYFGG